MFLTYCRIRAETVNKVISSIISIWMLYLTNNILNNIEVCYRNLSCCSNEYIYIYIYIFIYIQKRIYSLSLKWLNPVRLDTDISIMHSLHPRGLTSLGFRYFKEAVHSVCGPWPPPHKGSLCLHLFWPFLAWRFIQNGPTVPQDVARDFQKNVSA